MPKPPDIEAERSRESDKNSLPGRTGEQLQGLRSQVEATKQKEQQEEIKALKEWFKLRYKVDIRFEDKEEDIDGRSRAYPVRDIEKTIVQLEELKTQLVKIPPAFFEKLGVKEFVFAGRLTMKDSNDVEKEKFGAASPGYPSVYIVQTWSLYHELFHIMDGKFAGGLRGGFEITPFNRNWYMQNKEEWEALDPGTVGRMNLDEDQANYCYVLFNLDNKGDREKFYSGQILKDAGMQRKLGKMKEWLLTWSNGKFDEKYWADLEAGRVDGDYWTRR